jgi:glycogen debranching enzyme
MPDMRFDNPLIQASKFFPLVALRSITSRSGLGVYASTDTLYKGAVFGRDSLEVAEDLMDTNKFLAQRIFLTLGSLQGEVNDSRNEEEPGKIAHEYRRRIVDGKPLKGELLQIFETLSTHWGGTADEVTYYGSIDATPHFVRAIGRYTEKYGEKILDKKVVLRSGNHITMRIITENAVTWLRRHLEHSQSGLVEYQRQNASGDLNQNQVWKDSNEAYIHVDGTPVNHDSPMASIEVQGLAYDALLTAARLFPIHAEQYYDMALALRMRTLDLLWQPEEGYFALGTDFDADGSLRVIRTRMANAAALLDTAFFDEVPEETRQQMVAGIVRAVFSDDFLTFSGIRSRALGHQGLVPFKDYHGSFVSWPKETYDIAKGLRRQGFPELARELENRLLNICLRNLAYPEFIYVDGNGRVLPVRPSARTDDDVVVVDGPNRPEVIQAWTVSAIVAIIAKRARGRASSANLAKRAYLSAKRLAGMSVVGPPVREAWQRALENEILEQIPRVRYRFNPVALKALYPYVATRIERPGVNPAK